MKILVVFILGAACVAAQTGCVPESEEEEAYREVRSGLEAFAINLYQEVRSGESGNVVVSPLSAFVVLALTWMGARERTAQQVGDVLHLSPSRRRVAEGFRMLMDSLPTAANQSDNEVLVQLANRLYVQNGYPIMKTFKQTARKNFRSGIEELNFGDTASARNDINQWVANNTNGRIQDLISRDFLSADTRLVLVNALLFIGIWSEPFDGRQTTNETFHLSESEQVNVPMMHGSFRLEYSELPDFNATVLRLPYKGNNIQADMLIILPNVVDGLESLERNFGQVVMSSIPFQQRQVTVSLPKFTIETTIQLKEKLLQLGMRDIFGAQTADLSGVSSESLYVSDAVQKAYIRVDENGTEAAAATAVGLVPLLLLPRAEFKADHPFLFTLRVEETILFIGRVSNPL